MSPALSSSRLFSSAFRWASSSLCGKSLEHYKNDPEGYEAVARIFLGREEVARSVRDIVDISSSSRRRNLVVDGACGTGIVTDALAGSADCVLGIDLCPEALSFARQSKNPSLNFVQGDLHDFSAFAPGSIDVYSMAFAHRYIADLQAFYRKLAAALSSDGMAVISTAGFAKTLGAIEHHADVAGLVMKVFRPRFRSLFNRFHGSCHVVLQKPFMHRGQVCPLLHRQTSGLSPHTSRDST